MGQKMTPLNHLFKMHFCWWRDQWQLWSLLWEHECSGWDEHWASWQFLFLCSQWLILHHQICNFTKVNLTALLSLNGQERRKYLERSHWFTCGCAACKNNYPEYIRCAKDFKKLPGSAFKFKRCDRQKLNRDVESIKKEIKMCVSKVRIEWSYIP